MIIGQVAHRGGARRSVGLTLAAATALAVLPVLPVLPAGAAHAVESAPPAHVSAPAPRAPAPRAAPKATCGRRTGPYQRQVERWLKLTVDGKQSRSDCRAVAAFQKEEKIKPAIGFAGPVTWARMMLLSAGTNPNAAGKCPVRSYRVACVDLNRQLTWVQKGGKVVFGPVPMRSGRAGHRTRTGWHRIYWRHRNHWSTLYNTPMPYAQFFDRGEAFHAVYGSVFTTGGSWGCVNLRFADARKLWSVLKNRDRVYVWGRRPGL